MIHVSYVRMDKKSNVARVRGMCYPVFKSRKKNTRKDGKRYGKESRHSYQRSAHGRGIEPGAAGAQDQGPVRGRARQGRERRERADPGTFEGDRQGHRCDAVFASKRSQVRRGKKDGEQRQDRDSEENDDGRQDDDRQKGEHREKDSLQGRRNPDGRGEKAAGGLPRRLVRREEERPEDPQGRGPGYGRDHEALKARQQA